MNQDFKNKKCKKCGKALPEGYKYNCCEACRNKRVKKLKKIGKAVLGAGVTVGGLALTIVTRGKFSPKGKC